MRLWIEQSPTISDDEKSVDIRLAGNGCMYVQVYVLVQEHSSVSINNNLLKYNEVKIVLRVCCPA
jgi:hypothetical protein